MDACNEKHILDYMMLYIQSCRYIQNLETELYSRMNDNPYLAILYGFNLIIINSGDMGYFNYDCKEKIIKLLKFFNGGLVINAEIIESLMQNRIYFNADDIFDICKHWLENEMLNPNIILFSRGNILTAYFNKPPSEALLLLFIEHGADINQNNIVSINPLLRAINYDYFQLFKKILKECINNNSMDYTVCILQYAINQNSFRIVKYILDKNLVSDEAMNKFCKRLYFEPQTIITSLNMDIVELLISRGFDINVNKYYIEPYELSQMLEHENLLTFWYIVDNYKKQNDRMHLLINYLKDKKEISLIVNVFRDMVSIGLDADNLIPLFIDDIIGIHSGVDNYLYKKQLFDNLWKNLIRKTIISFSTRCSYNFFLQEHHIKILKKYFVYDLILKDSFIDSLHEYFIKKVLSDIRNNKNTCWNARRNIEKVYNICFGKSDFKDIIDMNRRLLKPIGSITVNNYILLNARNIDKYIFDWMLSMGGDINEPIINGGFSISLLDQLKTRDTNKGMIAYVQSKL